MERRKAMKKKLLLLAALLLSLVVILPACHTVLIELRSINGNIPCAISLVTYQVPGFGFPVQGAGPHQTSHSNVTGIGPFTDIGAGFGANFALDYVIQGVPGCYADGQGTLTGFDPAISLQWQVTWTISEVGSVKTAAPAVSAQ
jgi:hypothetical protein